MAADCNGDCFRAEGVRKMSDTQFEVQKKDWEPRKDLRVLIVEWWEAEE